MRAFVTGATGFVGGRLVEKLRARGDDVVCLVRTPEKAGALREAGCELVQGDLGDEAAIRKGVEGCDAVFHLAADYRVGVHPSQHPKMAETTVGGTTRVLDAAIAAKVPKIVTCRRSPPSATRAGRPSTRATGCPGDSFTFEYERTKVEAHRVAEDRIAHGAPIVIVQPGGLYGPGDHSAVGAQIEQATRGKLPALAFPK